MRKLTTLTLAASLLTGTLFGCVVAPATTTTTVTETEDGSTTTTVTTTVAPPPLPVYEQPAIPGPGYIWTPGYWAWRDADYYWVPGVWVLPPRVGVLWTPGWWGWSGGIYRWHAGYWGPTIGFYGGINYGFGYFGTGYVGGYWHGGEFQYNRTVNNIQNTHITNVYVQHVTNNTTINRVSYHGGSGGTTAQPTAIEKSALQQPHVAPTAEQQRQHMMAVHEHGQRYNPSGAEPAVFGTSRVSEHFNDPAAVRSPAQAHPHAPEAPRDVTPASRAAGEHFEERAMPLERHAAPIQRAVPQRTAPERVMPERERMEDAGAAREARQREALERAQMQRREAAREQRARVQRRAPRPERREREREER